MKTKKPVVKKKVAVKGVIKKNMTFMQILNKNPELMNTLFESGLHCMGCGMAGYETLEKGCLAHGLTSKKIDALIEKLNKQMEKKK